MTAPVPAPAGLAFFDLDRTVLSVNSASGWIRRELRLGFMSRRQALMGAWWIGKYQLGMAQMEDAIADAVRTLKGEDESVLRARTLDFWRDDLVDRVRPGARAALAEHKQAGDRCVLLTSSSTYLSEIACQELGLDDALCNRFVVVDGRFTGDVQRPLCFGPGKVHYAESLARKHGIDLGDCTFYTDSFSDLPVLLAVGHPVVVAPDLRLRRHARRRGWRVADWGG
ncbi:MAG: HAD family hydrolase [Oligoflexia bacterium]|nr:HAD family hydrolase [Oligoflexia bacterium]